MSFTRFHDDPARIQKQLEISTYGFRYTLDRPGPGTDLPYFEDPQIRLTNWGANLRDNTCNLESDLRGMTKRLNRNIPVESNFMRVDAPARNYNVAPCFVDESRATHPAWMYKDLEQTRWETPFINPQNPANWEIQFPTNIDTKMTEKDSFVPTPNGDPNVQFYMTGKSICLE